MMKASPLFPTLLLLLLAGRLTAQSPFAVSDSLSINNLNASVLLHGDLWRSLSLSGNGCEFPKGSGKEIANAGALWMSGYDDMGQLHVAAQTYRQRGNDYWPGPLDNSAKLNDTTSQRWARIWKVNRTDVQNFLALTSPDTLSIPESILRWPGKGNAYAQGNNSVPLLITTDMAPFVDLNADGIYEPLLGEYPDFPGDQALFWVFSDNGPTHNETNGVPLGVELHALAYAFSNGSYLDNTIFYKFILINKSATNYHNFRVGQWADFTLGADPANYFGYNGNFRMAVCYKATCNDGIESGFPPQCYGEHIPMAALSFLTLPGDNSKFFVPAGSFMYYNNDESATGAPLFADQYDRYLRSEFRNGQHLLNDYQGRGVPAYGTRCGANCDFVYTGDPGDTTQWSQCNCNDDAWLNKVVLASNDFNLTAGSSQTIVLALFTTNPDSANGCPLANFDSINNVANQVWNSYFSNNPPLPGSVDKVTRNGNMPYVYPNPVRDKLRITGTSGQSSFKIFNLLGQLTTCGSLNESTQQVDVAVLPCGCYIMEINDRNGNCVRMTFEKL